MLMDLQTCLKKMELVGVLAFAIVDAEGAPQIRNISAIHYEPDALYFFTARGKNFCRELQEDGRVQIEYFNLGVNPIFRETYLMGHGTIEKKGYIITDQCVGCGTCLAHCPQRCIEEGAPYRIRQEHCLHCGSCLKNCPVNAVERR